jgi:DNA-binding NarL/FixJ family response regulator
MTKPRVLIGDDHKLVVEGLKSVLARDFEIIGVAGNGRELVEEAERLRPDAILLDISMPLLNGIEATRQVKRVLPSTKVVIVTQNTDRAYVQAAFRNGASAYIAKDCVVSELVNAINQALSGYFYVTPALRKSPAPAEINLRENPSDLFGESLTPRQREVLQLVAEGKANKEIASMLGVSIKTVEYHKANLMEGLGLRTTAELTRYAIERGMIAVSPIHTAASLN